MKPTLRSFYFLSFFLISLTNLYAKDPEPPRMPMILEEIQSMREVLGDNAMYEMPVCEFNLKDLLSHMMTHCPSASPMLRECSKKLANGSLTLPLCDLLEIMPEVIRFVYESYEPAPTPEMTKERAPRPGAPGRDAAVPDVPRPYGDRHGGPRTHPRGAVGTRGDRPRRYDVGSR